MIASGYGVQRSGDRITAYLPMVAEGEGHYGWTDCSAMRTALYRDGELLGEPAEDPAPATFAVSAEYPAYTLTASVTRAPGVARASSRVDVRWDFRSERPAKGVKLPLSMARFTPSLGLDSTVDAGKPVGVPVVVQGTAATPGMLQSLRVYASVDGGKTWVERTVTSGAVEVKTPAAGGTVSLRGDIVDTAGTASQVTVYDAWLAR